MDWTHWREYLGKKYNAKKLVLFSFFFQESDPHLLNPDASLSSTTRVIFSTTPSLSSHSTFPISAWISYPLLAQKETQFVSGFLPLLARNFWTICGESSLLFWRCLSFSFNFSVICNWVCGELRKSHGASFDWVGIARIVVFQLKLC